MLLQTWKFYRYDYRLASLLVFSYLLDPNVEILQFIIYQRIIFFCKDIYSSFFNKNTYMKIDIYAHKSYMHSKYSTFTLRTLHIFTGSLQILLLLITPSCLKEIKKVLKAFMLLFIQSSDKITVNQLFYFYFNFLLKTQL